jgi:hypothetical protein
MTCPQPWRKQVSVCNYFWFKLLQSKNPSVENANDLPMLSAQRLSMMTKDVENEVETVYSGDSEVLEMKFDLIDPTVLVQNSDPNELTLAQKIHEGGAEYVAGFISKKFYETHPELHKTHQDYTSGSWVKLLSHGSLVLPSEYWFCVFKKFEEYFIAMHGDGDKINMNWAVTKTMECALNRRFPEIPPKIIKYYVRVRTRMRIDHVNRMKESKEFERKKIADGIWNEVQRLSFAQESHEMTTYNSTQAVHLEENEGRCEPNKENFAESQPPSIKFTFKKRKQSSENSSPLIHKSEKLLSEESKPEEDEDVQNDDECAYEMLNELMVYIHK